VASVNTRSWFGGQSLGKAIEAGADLFPRRFALDLPDGHRRHLLWMPPGHRHVDLRIALARVSYEHEPAPGKSARIRSIVRFLERFRDGSRPRASNP